MSGTSATCLVFVHTGSWSTSASSFSLNKFSLTVSSYHLLTCGVPCEGGVREWQLAPVSHSRILLVRAVHINVSPDFLLLSELFSLFTVSAPPPSLSHHVLFPSDSDGPERCSPDHFLICLHFLISQCIHRAFARSHHCRPQRT